MNISDASQGMRRSGMRRNCRDEVGAGQGARGRDEGEELRKRREENLELRGALAGASDLQDRLTKANERFEGCLARYQQMRGERGVAQ
jgi:hypothetical protein